MSTPHIRDYQGKHIHMIGIGGSSMSGLAQMLLEKGYRLTVSPPGICGMICTFP